MLYLALIQALVYATSPCGTLATDCAQKSPLSNLLVAPGPLLQGVSEALAVVSGMQLAYTMSPRESLFPPSFLLASYLTLTCLLPRPTFPSSPPSSFPPTSSCLSAHRLTASPPLTEDQED